MDRRKWFSSLPKEIPPESEIRSPLIDRKEPRSWSTLPSSSANRDSGRMQRAFSYRNPALCSRTIPEGHLSERVVLHRSRSRSAPRYRMNPLVRFAPYPEGENYGIGGYNTSRSRRLSASSSRRFRPKRLTVWTSWTRAFYDRLTRIRLRDTCSRVLTRLRGSS